MKHSHVVAFTIIAAFTLSGCGDTEPASPSPSLSPSVSVSPVAVVTPKSTPSPSPSETVQAADPYEVYLANNPDPSLILSREDAQVRAYLGCGTKFAPGTIDAVLAEAYADVCP